MATESMPSPVGEINMAHLRQTSGAKRNELVQFSLTGSDSPRPRHRPGLKKQMTTSQRVLSETENKSKIEGANIQNPERLWYQEAIFYEVYVRAFCDSNGDGHGDIQGMIFDRL